jgi:hypothetical protein
LQRLNERSSPPDQYGSSNGSIPITPATDEFGSSTPMTEPEAILVKQSEFQKLKNDLQQAKNEVVRMNQEMHSTHVARSTVEHLGQSSEADYSYADDVSEHTLTQLQNKFNAAAKTGYGWGNETRSFYNNASQQGFGGVQAVNQGQGPTRAPMARLPYRGRNSYLNEPTHFPLDQSYRGSGGTSNPPTRPSSAFEPQVYNQYMAPPLYNSYHPTPIGPMGTRLSPEASEFNVVGANMGPSPWNSQVSTLGDT